MLVQRDSLLVTQSSLSGVFILPVYFKNSYLRSLVLFHSHQIVSLVCVYISHCVVRNDNNQLLLEIRRANRPQTVMPSSVLSSDSMHIGLLAAAAHAASTNSRFTIFYNPR